MMAKVVQELEEEGEGLGRENRYREVSNEVVFKDIATM